MLQRGNLPSLVTNTLNKSVLYLLCPERSRRLLRCSKIKVMSPEGLMTYTATPKEIQILPPPQLMTVPAEVGRRIKRCRVLSKLVPGILTHTNVRHNDFIMYSVDADRPHVHWDS